MFLNCEPTTRMRDQTYPDNMERIALMLSNDAFFAHHCGAEALSTMVDWFPSLLALTFLRLRPNSRSTLKHNQLHHKGITEPIRPHLKWVILKFR